MGKSVTWPAFGIRRRIAVLLCLYVGLLAAGTAVVQLSGTAREQGLQRRFDTRTATAAAFLRSYVSDAQHQLRLLAEARFSQEVEPSQFARWIQSYGFEAAVLLDSQGRLLAVAPSKPELLGTRPTSRYRHLRQALAGRPAVSEVVPSAAQGRPLVAVAVPFYTPSGRRVLSGGHLVSDTPLTAYLTNTSSLPGSLSYLVDGNGALIATTSAAARSRGSLRAANPQAARLLDRRGRTSGTVTVDGQPFYVSAAKVQGTGWRVVFAVPTPVLYAPLRGKGSWGPWVGLVLFAVTGLLGVVAVARYLRAEGATRLVAAMVSNATDAITARRADGTISHWNAAATEMYQYSAEEALGSTVDLLVPAERRGELDELTARVLAGERVAPVDTVRRRKDGELIDVSLSMSPLLDNLGRIVGSVMYARDVTQARRQTEALHRAQEMFRLSFDSVPVGMAITGLGAADQARLLRVNPALCTLLGYPAEELQGRTFAELIHPDDLTEGEPAATDVLAGNTTAGAVQQRYLHADGHAVWTSRTSSVVTDERGAPLVTVTQVTDITEQMAEAERLSTLAMRDPLTGLPNRRSFTERLNAAAAHARHRNVGVALLFCDLDAFKPVNDQYGHAVGDEVLREAAARLTLGVRPGDTVGRLGGDEFVVLCEQVDPGGGDVVRARLASLLDRPYATSVGTLEVGCSIGLAEAVGDEVDTEALLGRADTDMFVHKRRRTTSPRAGARR